MATHNLYCIIGRSASGKSSLAKAVADYFGFQVVKSYTTRPIRPGENLEISDHIFITEKNVESYQEEMVAYTEINGYKYFTTYQMLMKANIYVIDPNGYKYLKENIKAEEINIIPIYISVCTLVAFWRAKKRKDNLSQWIARYEAEDEQFTEFESRIKSNQIECKVIKNNKKMDNTLHLMIDYITQQENK